MLVILTMLIQSGKVAGPPAPVATVRLTSRRNCQPSTNGDIVVCARDDSLYRLNKVPDRYRRSDSVIPTAKTTLADGSTLSAETEQADVGGFPSNRLMLRWKKGF